MLCHRATVQYKNVFFMNVTLKIDDRIGREARHRAVDAGLSLSGWVTNLIRKEIDRDRKQDSLLELLGNDELARAEVDFPRDRTLGCAQHRRFR